MPIILIIETILATFLEIVSLLAFPVAKLFK
jgi:hypothetical protein